MEKDFQHWALDSFINLGASEEVANKLTLALDLLLIIIISLLVDLIARRVIMRLVGRIVKKTKNDWDDIFYDKRVFNGLAHIIPALIISYSTDFILAEYPKVVHLIDQWVLVYIFIIVSLVINRVLNALEILVSRSTYFEGKPIGSFIQLFKILNYIIVIVLILSQLIGKSPLTVLGAFGAGTAVLLLIFRDTILGLVASIQLSMNDMVRLGDWISMEKFGADGDVTEINLTTVKVRNWDKTITTIPTYAFVSDSFKNWRGMSSSGVRRIKRHLLIDMHTIGFLKDENIMKLGGYELLKQYLAERQKEINEFNEAQKIDRKEIINGRNMTNIGVFRQYAVEYIKRHPKVSRTETLMVRQLQPTELGLPLEIYCFSDTIEWVYYEGVISDIFDHLMAAAPFFGLQVFQSPSGSNFKELLKASTSQE